MTEDTRFTSPLKKVKNIRQYVFFGKDSSIIYPIGYVDSIFPVGYIPTLYPMGIIL